MDTAPSKHHQNQLDSAVLGKLRDMPETQLQVDVVLPLLAAMGATHVQNVHGAFERGKDVVFLLRDTLSGEAELAVCQVKSQKLTGKSGHNSAAVTALNQLLQCADTKVLHPERHVKEVPIRVYFFTTFPFPDGPLADSDPLLQKVRLRCKIIGPDQIVTSLREHLPDQYYDLAHPGHGITREILRYVSVHHEAPAFNLSKRRFIKEFFVNLSLSPNDNLIARIASGMLTYRSPKQFSLEKSLHRCVELQYSTIRARISGPDLFTVAHQASTSGVSAADTLPQSSKKGVQRLDHTSFKSLNYDGFFRSLATYVSAADKQLRRTISPATRERIANEVFETLIVAEHITELLCSHLGDDLLYRDDGAPGKSHKFKLEEIEPASLLGMPGNTCILGAAGAGKTCFARMLAEAAINRGDNCLYFPCARIRDPETSLETAILEFLCSIRAIDESGTIQAVLSNTQLLILDGCDEAATYRTRLANDISSLAGKYPISIDMSSEKTSKLWLPDYLRQVIVNRRKRLVLSEPLSEPDWRTIILGNASSEWESELSKLKEAFDRSTPRIVITTREADHLELSSTFVQFRLLPFNDHQLNRFFTRWFEGAPAKQHKVIDFLAENLRIKEICRNPITATIVAAIHERDLPLPQSKTDIYGTRFSLLLERWDSIRSVVSRTRITPNDKMLFLTRLALRLHRAHRREFVRQDAASIWRNGLNRQYPDVTVDDLIQELGSVDNVVFREYGDVYSLGHLSYQEYLTARAISLGSHISFLVSKLLDPWWRQVAVFYAGYTGDITKLLSRLSSTADLRPHSGLIREMLDEAKQTSELALTATKQILSER